RVCEQLAGEIPTYFRGEREHPLELGLRLHQFACEELVIDPSPSALARSMCMSPFDAAIHDAAGRALCQSAFAFYEEHAAIASADAYFPGRGACRAIRDVLREPRLELAAWYIAGMEEPLDTTMVPATARHGYKHFKLKLSGCNIERD